MTSGRGRRLTMATLIVVNMLWAAQYPAYKIASERMGAAALNFWALTAGIALLTPFAVIQARRRTGGRSIHFGRTILQFTAAGAFGIVPASVMLAWGIDRSTASNAAILSLTIPVLMTLLAVVILGERLTVLRVAGLALALAGTLVISWTDISGDLVRRNLLLGNAVIFLAGLGSAFYNTYGKVLLEIFSEVEVLIGSYAVAALCCAAASLFGDAVPFYRVTAYPAAAWVSIGVLGAFPWGIAMVLWMWVLKRLEASQASVSIYLLPIFGVLLSALTLHEKIGLLQLGGGLLVVFATWLTSEYEARRVAHDLP